MLDVKRMRVLREVAARGSFSGAADALSYTQSAVSQQIAALEREAGAVLVERNARGVRLTDAGPALVAHADAILARLDAAERELEAIAGLRGGHLRLVAFPSAASSPIPLAVAGLRRRHPQRALLADAARLRRVPPPPPRRRAPAGARRARRRDGLPQERAVRRRAQPRGQLRPLPQRRDRQDAAARRPDVPRAAR